MKHYTAQPAGVGRAEHAEGPMWDPRHERMIWVDQFAGLVHSARFEDGALEIERTFSIGAPVGVVVPMAGDEGWMIAAGAGFGHLAFDGTVTMVAELIDVDEMRVNDGKVDPLGRFWAGFMSWEWQRKPGSGSLYRLDPDLAVTQVRTGLTISNGLAWTPDGATMYFIDSPTQRVDRFVVDAAGVMAREGTVVEIPVEVGTPDGMSIDDEGCLWVALWGGNAVQRYSPQGELLARVEVDAPQVSSCAFGGPDRTTLFITTSQEGYSPTQSAEYPHAGEIFTVDVDVSGPVTAQCAPSFEVRTAG